MSAPVRWRDDTSAPEALRAMAKSAGRSRAMPPTARARTSAHVHRLMVVPATAGVLLGMKGVAVAALCAAGTVIAARAVPALTHHEAPAQSAKREEPGALPAVRHAPSPSAPPPPLPPANEGEPAPPSPELVPVPIPPRHVTPASREPLPAGPVSPAPASPAREADSLAREAVLLEQARARMGHAPEDALAVLSVHAATYPAGQLAMERELLAVDALRRLGRNAEARARGAALLGQAEGSIYEARVRAMLAMIEGP